MTIKLPEVSDGIENTTDLASQSTHRLAHWASAMAAAIVMSGCATDPRPRYTEVYYPHPSQRAPVYIPPIQGNISREQALIEALKKEREAKAIEEQRNRLDREERKQHERMAERRRQLALQEREYRKQHPTRIQDGVIVIDPRRY